MTTRVAAELAPWNIRVTSIAPGFMRTQMGERCARRQPGVFSVMGSALPLGRIGETSDFLGAVKYLLSDGAAYSMGAGIQIASGMICVRIAS
jgi:NAD(P)-dependent dehydrogenase (short-subunit alcohol dehydrogenase family)